MTCSLTARNHDRQIGKKTDRQLDGEALVHLTLF